MLRTTEIKGAAELAEKAGLHWPTNDIEPLSKIVQAASSIENSPRPHPSKVARIINCWKSGRFDDIDLIPVFGFRTKQDASIRRTRLKDILRLHNRQDLVAMAPALANCNYIMCSALLWAALIEGPNFVLSLQTHGILPNSETIFAKKASAISNYIKSRGLTTNYPAYVEMQNLCGFRTLPYPQFNFEQAARLLASGMPPENIQKWQDLFEDHLQSSLPESQTSADTHVTLEQFIAGEVDWATGGMANGIKVDIKVENTTKTVRASKALFSLVIEPMKFIEAFFALESDVHSVFPKCEPAKVRLAVSASNYSYLTKAWIMYMSDRLYSRVKNCVTEISTNQYLQFIHNKLKILPNKFAMPFDFAMFESHPTLLQGKQMFTSLVQHIMPNQQLDSVMAKLLFLADNTYLSLKKQTGYEGNNLLIKHTGGLTSGGRDTTLINNLYNRTVMSIAGATKLQSLSISGDDSDMIDENPKNIIAVKSNLDAMGIRGSKGKFDLLWQQTEFLRVWYTVNGAFGYRNRTILGIVSRKPWSNDPYIKYDYMTQALDQFRISCLRAMKPKHFFQDKASQMTKYFISLAPAHLKIPLLYSRTVGGLGLDSKSDYILKKIVKPLTISELDISLTTPVPLAVSEALTKRYSTTFNMNLSPYMPKFISHRIKQVVTGSYSSYIKTDLYAKAAYKLVQKQYNSKRYEHFIYQKLHQSVPIIRQQLQDLVIQALSGQEYEPIVDRKIVSDFITLSEVAKSNLARVSDISPITSAKLVAKHNSLFPHIRRQQFIDIAQAQAFYPPHTIYLSSIPYIFHSRLTTAVLMSLREYIISPFHYTHVLDIIKDTTVALVAEHPLLSRLHF